MAVLGLNYWVQYSALKYKTNLRLLQTGTAFRVCLNSTWLWGDWTNYTECADSFEAYSNNAAEKVAAIASSTISVCGTQNEYCIILKNYLQILKPEQFDFCTKYRIMWNNCIGGWPSASYPSTKNSIFRINSLPSLLINSNHYFLLLQVSKTKPVCVVKVF